MENEVKELTPQEQGDKVAKRYETNLKKLVALFGGEKSLKTSKIKNTEVNAIIEELTKERKENLVKEFKTKAAALLDRKVEFDKFIKQEEEKFKQAINNKKKEFSQEMEDCFKIVESIDNLTKEYAETFENLNK